MILWTDFDIEYPHTWPPEDRVVLTWDGHKHELRSRGHVLFPDVKGWPRDFTGSWCELPVPPGLEPDG